eukprot:gene2128-18173_t
MAPTTNSQYVFGGFTGGRTCWSEHGGSHSDELPSEVARIYPAAMMDAMKLESAMTGLCKAFSVGTEHKPRNWHRLAGSSNNHAARASIGGHNANSLMI